MHRQIFMLWGDFVLFLQNENAAQRRFLYLTTAVCHYIFDVSVPMSVPVPLLVSIPLLSVLLVIPMLVLVPAPMSVLLSVFVSKLVSDVPGTLSLVPVGVDVPGVPDVSFDKSKLSSQDVRIMPMHNTAESIRASESNIAVTFLFSDIIFISAPFVSLILIFPDHAVLYGIICSQNFHMLLPLQPLMAYLTSKYIFILFYYYLLLSTN